MGLLDWLKTPEGAFLLGMPIGYLLINWGKSKFQAYLEKTGKEIGKNIAQGMGIRRREYEPVELEKLYRILESLDSRISNLEKSLGYKK